MHSKYIFPKIILHNLFIIIAYAISLFICLFVPINLYFIFFVPFNYIFQVIFLFIFDAFIYLILNRMPFIRGLHAFFFILLPTLLLLVIGIIIVYLNVPISSIPNNDITQFDDETNMKIFIVMLILPYFTIFLSYLRHVVKCEKCGKSGICLMVRKEHFTTTINDNSYTYTHTAHGKIGEVKLKSSGEHVGDIYGDYEETVTGGSITEERNYSTDFRCKCCGNFFSKNWEPKQISGLRKLKDKIMKAKDGGTNYK